MHVTFFAFPPLLPSSTFGNRHARAVALLRERRLFAPVSKKETSERFSRALSVMFLFWGGLVLPVRKLQAGYYSRASSIER